MLSSSLYFGDSMRYIHVNFKFRWFFFFFFFLHTDLNPFKQSRLDFSNPKQTLLESNYLKSTAEGLSFQISFVPNAGETWLSLPVLLLIENTRGVNVPWSIGRIISL